MGEKVIRERSDCAENHIPDYRNNIHVYMNWIQRIASLVKPKIMTYAEKYTAAKIRPEKLAEVNFIATRISKGRGRYEAIQQATGIPWWFVGILHFMEAGHLYPNQFNYHLHCGDPLTDRTFHVPKGRPVADPKAGKGNPYTWEESALDAVQFMGLDKVTNWSIQNCLDLFEKYNGMGYKKRGVPNPYLWSYTQFYTAGKYVLDGKFDPKAVSKQPGVAAIMMVLGI